MQMNVCLYHDQMMFPTHHRHAAFLFLQYQANRNALF